MTFDIHLDNFKISTNYRFHSKNIMNSISWFPINIPIFDFWRLQGDCRGGNE